MSKKFYSEPKPTVDLREHWPSPDLQLHEALLRRYREPHRRYHTLQHLAECFERLDELRPLVRAAREVTLALWFHDAIYEPRRDDNEERSADLARENHLDDVADLVLATRHRTPAEGDAAIVVDADLWILAAPRLRFEEYETQVHEEYSWMPWPAYRRSRAAIIGRFLARETIFCTKLFVERYEKRARTNLARALARL
jgi:predicted metal-dependent HD superfamily phosphohydrolase